MSNVQIFWEDILVHLLEPLSFRLRCPSFLSWKVTSESKLIQSMVRSVASFRILGICVTSSVSRILVSKFWGLEWRFLSLKVPVLGYQSSVVNEAIRRNSFFLIRNFKWKKTQKKKLLLLLFNIRLFFFFPISFYLFCIFCVAKSFLKKKLTLSW